MMLLMFAVGAMNVLWMAALGMVMTIEKMLHRAPLQPRDRRALIAVGGLRLHGAAVAAHWPPPAN